MGTSLFLAAAPGVAAGAVPWLLTRWHAGERPYPLLVRVGGAALLVGGGAVLIRAFTGFVREGRGTPAPVAPTERLVIGGPYRHVRNPMYVAVLAVVLGQALLLARPVLVVYAGGLGAAFVAFVRGYEEPTLRRRFGEDYEAYRRHVPAWWPRLRPWRP
ncbi:MAG TPA: isoprenylcysteine carboxylmethyltransferase family protein [Acidimicrobiales bacterium]